MREKEKYSELLLLFIRDIKKTLNATEFYLLAAVLEILESSWEQLSEFYGLFSFCKISKGNLNSSQQFELQIEKLSIKKTSENT